MNLTRLKRLRSIQRFCAGSFVVPKRCTRSLSLTLLLLICSILSSTIFEYFAKERAELYWCYDQYKVGQRPCETRDASKVDFLCILLGGISLISFILAFLPFNVFNLIYGVDRQNNVALTIMQTRKRRLEKIMSTTTIDLQKCSLLGGYEMKCINPNKATRLLYWDAVKEELYTRVFSVLPCEVYCNWIYGNKLVSVLLILLAMVNLSVPCVCLTTPIYINVWLFVASLSSFVAPLQALVITIPIVLNPRNFNAGCVTAVMIILFKMVGLICAKYFALKHEKRMVKTYIRNCDHWIQSDVKEKYLLYLLGFDGFF